MDGTGQTPTDQVPAERAPTELMSTDRLAVLKALGDNTRYAIFLEVARSASPLSTTDVADTLGLHPNTVRPHLERMRDVGLLDVEVDARGSVGRPQHRYLPARDAPSLGLEPPAFPMLAGMLAALAATGGFAPDDAAAAAFDQGRNLAAKALSERPSGWPAPTATALDGYQPVAQHDDPPACPQALIAAMAQLGFDPETIDLGESVVVAFTRCPYRELAEAHPEMVCHLHRGLIEGFLAELSQAGMAEVAIGRFATLTDRDACQVELSVR